MLAQELDKINQELEVGLRQIYWNAHEKIEEFIHLAMHSVTSVDGVMKTLKDGVVAIELSLKQFKEGHPFFPFSATNFKTATPDDFGKKYADHHKKQVADLTERGTVMHDAVQKSYEVLNEIKATNEFEALSQDSGAWINYITYINGIMQSTLLTIIQYLTSLLQNQVDSAWISSNNGIPLLDVKLMLTQLKNNDPKNP